MHDSKLKVKLGKVTVFHYLFFLFSANLNWKQTVKNLLFILIHLIGLSALSFLDLGVMIWLKVRKVVHLVTKQSWKTDPENLELE